MDYSYIFSYFIYFALSARILNILTFLKTDYQTRKHLLTETKGGEEQPVILG